MITTRPFRQSDADVFLSLYRACLAHYAVPPASATTQAAVIAHLTAGRHMSGELAFDGAQPVGFATWALTFPARDGFALLMKELFVVDTARGKGVGRALMAALLDHATAHDCVRLDWQTDGDNTGARGFYSALSAPEFQKVSYRIDAADFDRFQQRLTQ